MKTYIEIKCDYCNKKFNRLLGKYRSQIKNEKITNFFCSRKCKYSFSSKTNSIQSKCKICNKSFKRKKSEAKKSKSGKLFCSQSCAAIYNNKLKRKSRRSKIEAQFYNLLVKEFPTLNILPNDKTMLDGLEVDVAIPSLKLAIEWNGIVHFKPIYGKDKLNKIQNKDAEKLKIASNKNINLIIISDLVSNSKILNQAFNDIKNIINKLT